MSQPKLFRNNVKQLSILATVAIIGMITILSAFFLVSDSASNSYATSINSEITAEIGGTRYITLTTPDAALSLTPGSSAQTTTTTTQVTASSNAASDIDLYLSMSGDSADLYLNGDSTSGHSIAATSTTGSLSNFATNTWGYSTDGTNYTAVPTSREEAAHLGTIAESPSGETSGSVSVYYGLKADSSLAAGQYTGGVTYSAVVSGGLVQSASIDSIVIDKKPAEAMKVKKVNTVTIRTDLRTNTYGTPRVYFKSNSSAAAQECKPVTVARNGDGYMTITCDITPTTDTTTGEFHIVPRGGADDVFCQNGTYTPGTSDCEAGDWQWGSFTITGVTVQPDVQTMQNFSCSSLSTNQQIQLQDSRDKKMYWVGKLPDGNCWMTQNLDLDLSTSRTLTPADTNISSNWTPRTSTTTGSFSGYNSSSGDTGKSHNPGDVYYENASGTDQHYHVGNYYQWSAATAGYTGTSRSAQSICPKGWALPSDDQSLQLINSGLSESSFMNAPYYLLRGGWLRDSSLNYAGLWGYYWLSRPDGSDAAYSLVVESNNVYVLGMYNWRYLGQPVRCVAAG